MQKEKPLVIDRENMERIRKQAEAKGQTVAAYIQDALEQHLVKEDDREKS
jgi:predicted DNA-binding protein